MTVPSPKEGQTAQMCIRDRGRIQEPDKGNEFFGGGHIPYVQRVREYFFYILREGGELG